MSSFQSVESLSNKVNAVIIGSEPSSKVTSNEKSVPKRVEFTSKVGNAKAEITK